MVYKTIVGSIYDVIYEILLKLDRRKRNISHGHYNDSHWFIMTSLGPCISHGPDTIDYGYQGLRDHPFEYEIYPLIQNMYHTNTIYNITRLYLNDCRLTTLPSSIIQETVIIEHVFSKV